MTNQTKKTLYVGLEPPQTYLKAFHFPVIQIVPRSFNSFEIVQNFKNIPQYTHLIFTSKSSVKLFYQLIQHFNFDLNNINQIPVIAVGNATAQLIINYGGNIIQTAKKECAEGIIEIIEKMNPNSSHFFWPHSSGARNIIKNFFNTKNIKLSECVLYDTLPLLSTERPNLDLFDEIIFTSPSTIDAFIKIFGSIPPQKQLNCIGPITQKYLNQILSDN